MTQVSGGELLDRRELVPFREVKVPGATVRFAQRTSARPSFEGVYATPQNFLAMYHGIDGAVEGRYLCDRTAAFSKVGQVVFRPANYEVQARGVARNRRMECWFTDERLRTVSNNHLVWDPDQLEQTFNINANGTRSLMHRMFQELVNPGMAAEVVVDSLMVVILSDLSRNLSGKISRAPEKGFTHAQALSQVMERIADCAEVLPTVSELASLAALSERHLLRLFKRVHGHSLCHYIREARVEKAKHFLAWTDLPLKEIAYRLNFSTHANFTTAFVRETGVTPSDFRRNNTRSFNFPASQSSSLP